MLVSAIKALSAGGTLILLSLTILTTGCAPKLTAEALPALPPSYYNCIDTFPYELVHTYFMGYGEISGPKALYDNKVFVFKDQPLTDWAMRQLEEGCLWLDMIKCQLANPEDVAHFKMGDHFDLVGFNLGPPDVEVPELAFKDCYILPVGAIKLPAGESAGGGLSGY